MKRGRGNETLVIPGPAGVKTLGNTHKRKRPNKQSQKVKVASSKRLIPFQSHAFTSLCNSIGVLNICNTSSSLQLASAGIEEKDVKEITKKMSTELSKKCPTNIQKLIDGDCLCLDRLAAVIDSVTKANDGWIVHLIDPSSTTGISAYFLDKVADAFEGLTLRGSAIILENASLSVHREPLKISVNIIQRNIVSLFPNTASISNLSSSSSSSVMAAAPIPIIIPSIDKIDVCEQELSSSLQFSRINQNLNKKRSVD